MTAYGLVGVSNGKKGTIEAALDDLLDAAVKADEEFWLILPYDGKASDGVERVLDWASEIEDLYYQLVTPSAFKADKDDEFYEGAAEIHKAKDIDGTILRLLVEASEKEEAALLVLLDEDDEDLVDTIREATAKGVGAFDILDGGAELEFPADDDGDDPEPEPEAAETVKKRSAGGRRGTGAAAPTAPPEKGKPGRKPRAAKEEPEDPGEDGNGDDEPAPEAPKPRKAGGAAKKAAAAKDPIPDDQAVAEMDDETIDTVGEKLAASFYKHLGKLFGA